MEITIIHFIILTLSLVIARLQPPSGNVESETVDKVLVDLLKRCLVTTDAKMIMYVGEKSTFLATDDIKFWSSLILTSIEDSDTTNDKYSVSFPYKFPIFVLSISDDNSTMQSITSLKETRWWNHTGIFIQLDKSSSSSSVNCSAKARELLLTAWKMDILWSILLCNDEKISQGTESVILYTFNPFKDIAPTPWKKVETIAGPKDHPWTLFEQPYDAEQTTCDSIIFESRMLDVNGYKILANGKPDPPRIIDKPDDKGPITGIDMTVLGPILKKLNAKLNITFFPANSLFGDTYTNGTSDGLLGDVRYDKYDLSVNMRFLLPQFGVEITTYISKTPVLLVTNHRGWKSPLEKIVSYVKPYILLALFITCLVTVIIMDYSISGWSSIDYMDVLRLYLSASISRIPEDFVRRLLLFNTFWFVLVVTATFQGKLAALLTSSDPSQQVETVQDAEKLGYTIYGLGYMKVLVPEEIQTIYRTVGLHGDYNDYCNTALSSSNDSACIAGPTQLFLINNQTNLYKSKFSIGNFYQCYMTRGNWPLFTRFKILMQRIIETRSSDYWKQDEVWLRQEYAQPKSAENSFKAITLEDLKFSFIILIVGLLFATIEFVAEIIVASPTNIIV